MVIKTNMSEVIEEFLKTNLLINQNILGIIENLPELHMYVDNEKKPKGIFVQKGYMHYLYSKEEHRGKGYAGDVTIDLASKIIKSGKIPYLQIIKGNNMSPGIAKKCGFVECGYVSWMGIVAGNVVNK